MNKHKEIIKKSCDLIKKSIKELSLKNLANQFNLSPSYFQKLFKQEIKETIKSKVKPKVEPVQEQKQAKPTVPVNQETTKTEEPVIPVTEPEETRPINANQAGQFMLFDDVYVETNEFGEPLTEEEISSQNVPEICRAQGLEGGDRGCE